jgi:hypothetical protein
LQVDITISSTNYFGDSVFIIVAACHLSPLESLEEGASSRIKALKNKKPNSSLNSELLPAMQGYLDAADSYFKDRCYTHANNCLAMAALVGLQVQVPDTKMINLTDSEVLQLMTHRGLFQDTLTIATAYHKNEPSNWIG